MRVDKVILKAALSTLAAIAILCVLLVLTMCFLFPQTMMEVTYGWGMNEASIYFASVSYNRSGEAHYAAFATEAAIGANYDSATEYYGELLLADDGFAAYAQRRDDALPEDATMTYCQYIQGQVCVAKYDQGKKTEAVDLAFEYVGQAFPKGNPAALVYLTALIAEDSATADQAYAKMQGLSSLVTGEDATYLGELMSLMSP